MGKLIYPQLLSTFILSTFFITNKVTLESETDDDSDDPDLDDDIDDDAWFFITVLAWLLVGEGVGVDKEDGLEDKQILLLPPLHQILFCYI